MRASVAMLVAMLAMATAVPTAYARGTVAIVSHEDIVVMTGSGRAPADEEVRKAILVAAAATKNPWTVTTGEAGALVATTVVRGKHTASVNIKYSGARYSVTYHDSANMKYEVENGVAKIHPYYNTWVQGLVNAINAQLNKL